MSNELRLLRDKDVAEKLAIGISTVWEWAKKGRIPKPRKIGATTVWSSEEIDGWIRDQFKEAA